MPDTIRALERGLQVLDVLQQQPTASLHDVYLATGISKPSLLRIFNTLEHAGVVSRRLVDGHYRLSAFNRRDRKRDRHDRVAEAAVAVMHRLCLNVRWPSDLMVPAGDHMERRETSQTYTPFFMPLPPHRTSVGQKVNWLLSGVGRAYLAFCPDAEREKILRRLRQSLRPEDQLARDPRRLARILTETRQRGYATRDPAFFGGRIDEPPRDDGLVAIAVPVRHGPRVYASLNLLWLRSAFTVEDFAARHLAALQTAADEIAFAVRNAGTARARPD